MNARHADEAFIDPVCGMTVAADSPHTAEHAGQPVKFCSAGCRTKFLKEPTRYLAATSPVGGAIRPVPAAQPSSNVAAGTIYTCPMHPEIRQIGPGHCPKCGMALEPLMPTEVADESEIRGVRWRFWMATTLAIPVMLIAMAPHLLGWALDSATAWTLRILELSLSAPVVLWAAAPYY
jgi:Cu+-exporting ATPase